MYAQYISITRWFPIEKKELRDFFLSIKSSAFDIEIFVDICESRSQIISVETLERYRRYQEESRQPARIPPVTSTGRVIYFHRFLSLFTACVCVCVIGSALTYDLGDSPDDDSGPNFPTSWLTRMSKCPII